MLRRRHGALGRRLRLHRGAFGVFRRVVPSAAGVRPAKGGGDARRNCAVRRRHVAGLEETDHAQGTPGSLGEALLR